MAPIILREKPMPEDDSWIFNATLPPAPKRPGMGKHVSFTPDAIKFDYTLYPSNRILHSDDISQFILASFDGLRFPDKPPSTGRDYKIRLFKAGFHLNGVQYRFYGHSNSQLRSGSCFLRAGTDKELDDRINSFGDFAKIKNVAKRAKRIGLLFSKAEIDWTLNPQYTEDIDDMIVNGENFSDGCGLIAPQFAKLLSKRKRLIFHGRPYTPCVYQIRYKGYKGVLMLHPELNKNIVAQFRSSQRKFRATKDDTFSVVNHSVPYAYARLNNEIVVLLASLGISSETFLDRQRKYHQWIEQASSDWEIAFNLLCALKHFPVAERLLLQGIDSQDVQARIRAAQMAEIGAFKKNEKFRARMIIPQSRFLFGVNDPYGVLKEGEVHVKVSIPRKGASTLKNTQVLVVRNPCLHPGDCLKLWAVEHPRLAHLVDCIVFASTGRRAAPSMSAGGDLDGDEYTVIWDPDFVPRKVAESYTYPPGKEHLAHTVTREDLARHFASYNTMTLAKLVNLHNKWVRCSPKGAMSDQCQDLNALHSLVVDGGNVKIPEHLKNPPENPDEPYIIDLLRDEAKAFHDQFMASKAPAATGDTDVAPEEIFMDFISSEKLGVSEYELAMMASRFASTHNIDFHKHFSRIDFSAFSTAEKHAFSLHQGLTPERDPYIWNSLMRSDILHSQDLHDRNLGGPLRLQRLYCSTIQGRQAFFEYLQDAIANFTRRLLILKTDDRFSVGVFLRGPIEWDAEAVVDQNVTVCSFMPKASGLMSTYWYGRKGYKLYCGDSLLQLFNQQRGDSFIFVTRPAVCPDPQSDIITSIALNKISGRVQQQCGRVRRAPVVTLEIHVVSNRDRVAHQAFDLRFEHVQTEEFLKRFEHESKTFSPNSIHNYDWSGDQFGKQIFDPTSSTEQVKEMLLALNDTQLQGYFDLAIKYRVESHIFMIFDLFLSQDKSLDELRSCIESYPSLVYCVVKKHIPEGPAPLPDSVAPLAATLVHNIISCANEMGIASLAALERLVHDIDLLELATYCDLLWYAALVIRAPTLLQEVLFVLHESRLGSRKDDLMALLVHKHALGIVIDRAEEAADTCLCDENGRIRRQKVAPARAKLFPPRASENDKDAAGPAESEKTIVVARHRVDAPTPARIHSHVRLQVASAPEGAILPAAVVDAVVLRAARGEMYLDVKRPVPPEWQEVDWNIFDAGSTATSAAMLDAVLRLAREGRECCAFADALAGVNSGAEEEAPDEGDVPASTALDEASLASLNHSQRSAVVASAGSQLTLIWGPPGTGKTTVVVQILLLFLRQNPETKILMSASTHNAVDNVLERFLVANDACNLLKHEQILRVATESTKVHKDLQPFTVDARVGGSVVDNPRLVQKATSRVKEARIVFTTCTGAGLGLLRNVDFETVLIDEASQITEPGALIPLVKGCRRAVLVGDHVQLRPTVKPMGKVLEFDKSLFERLYTGPEYPGMTRTMLEVQYRFSAALAHFPSHEFYEGRLQTGNSRAEEIASTLGISSFPWPRGADDDRITPVVFAPCTTEEDYGRASKSNAGQAGLAKYIVSLLRKPQDATNTEHAARLDAVSIAALTPYSRQVQLLRQMLPQSVTVSTIDGFQGREADVVVFSTVRANMEGEIGFVEDARRLNVAWTRPKLGLVIVGDARTLKTTSPLWQRALAACTELVIERPDAA